MKAWLRNTTNIQDKAKKKTFGTTRTNSTATANAWRSKLTRKDLEIFLSIPESSELLEVMNSPMEPVYCCWGGHWNLIVSNLSVVFMTLIIRQGQCMDKKKYHLKLLHLQITSNMSYLQDLWIFREIHKFQSFSSTGPAKCASPEINKFILLRFHQSKLDKEII